MNGDGRLFAFGLATGQQNWVVPKAGSVESYFLQFQCQPGTAPDGTIYVTEFGTGGSGWGLQAFAPQDGARTWRFDPNIASEASGPVTGANGTIYFGWDLSRVSAVSPGGNEMWRAFPSDGVRTAPSVSPDDATVLVGGGAFGLSGSMQALDTADGGELWRLDLPQGPGGEDLVPDARALFTPDSKTAYFPVSVLGDSPAFRSCFLYSLRVGDAPFASR
jgi:outer membrane protein assembly factor BamB